MSNQFPPEPEIVNSTASTNLDVNKAFTLQEITATVQSLVEYYKVLRLPKEQESFASEDFKRGWHNATVALGKSIICALEEKRT